LNSISRKDAKSKRRNIVQFFLSAMAGKKYADYPEQKVFMQSPKGATLFNFFLAP